MRKIFVFLSLMTVILAACSGAQEPTSTPTQPPQVEAIATKTAPPIAPTDTPEVASEVAAPIVQSGYPAPDEVNTASAIIDQLPYPDPGDMVIATDYKPQDSDSTFKRSTVTFDMARSELVIAPGQPPRVYLVLRGYFPDPCHLLRVVQPEPDDQKQIDLEVYAIVNPNKGCVDVIQNFMTLIPLRDVLPGKYVVLVNGEKLGEFER